MTVRSFLISRTEPLANESGAVPDASSPVLEQFLMDTTNYLIEAGEEWVSHPSAFFDQATGKLTVSGIIAASDESTAKRLASPLFNLAVLEAGAELDDTLASWKQIEVDHLNAHELVAA